MSEVAKDFTGILSLIVGVAFLTVLVKPGNQTPQVVNATFGGFSQALSVAMGGSYSGAPMSFGG